MPDQPTMAQEEKMREEREGDARTAAKDAAAAGATGGGKQQQQQHISQQAPAAATTTQTSAEQFKPKYLQAKFVAGSKLSDAETTALYDIWRKEANDFVAYFARKPIDKIRPRMLLQPTRTAIDNERILAFRESTPLHKAFRHLVDEGFSSAPVVDDQQHYVGNLDMLHIVRQILYTLHDWVPTVESDQHIHGTDLRQRAHDYSTDNEEGRPKSPTPEWHYSRHGNKTGFELWLSLTVGDACERKFNDFHCPQYPVAAGASLFGLLEVLVRTHQHLVATINSDQTIDNVMTTSMLTSIIDQTTQELNRFSLMAETPIKLLMSMLPKHVESVKQRDPALAAFKLMIQHNIHAVAVLDDHSHLVDTISSRDIRVLGNVLQDRELILKNAADFKERAIQKYPEQTPAHPIYVTRHEFFSDAIKRFFDGNLHRVWVTEVDIADDGTKSPCVPDTVITQRDMLRIWLHFAMQPSKIRKLIESGSIEDPTDLCDPTEATADDDVLGLVQEYIENDELGLPAPLRQSVA